MRLADAVMERAQDLIADRLGLDFRGTQASRLERGVHQALRAASVPAANAGDYLARVMSLPDGSVELMRLAAHLTVGETYFFRDSACFGALERTVLPEIIAGCRQRGGRTLRIWSAGCATGEEAYSLAIVLDRLPALPHGLDAQILGTDVDPDALEAARRGIYREWSLRATPDSLRKRYFRRLGDETYELNPEVRRRVTFLPLNLVDGTCPPAVSGGIDLIVCRNVLMYFTPEAMRRTAARLRGALAADGWLATSPAEASAELFRPLIPVNFPGAILFRERPVVSSHPPARSATPSTLPGVRAVAVGEAACVERPLVPDARTPSCPEPPPAARALLARARTLADRGRLQEARRECEAALALDTLDPDAHLLLATIALEEGSTHAAREALRRVLYLAPDSALAQFFLGALLFQQGERSRGKRCMEITERLLHVIPPDRLISGTNDLRAHQLLQATRAYLDADGGTRR